MKNDVIFLARPAVDWEDTTPVGNGYMGASLYGAVDTEVVQLNEERIWSGETFEAATPGYMDKLRRVQELLLEGRAAEADKYAAEALDGSFHRIKSYETAGELRVSVHKTADCSSYRRELDLTRGVASVVYEKEGARFSRELFASYPDRVIVLRFSGGSLELEFTYVREKLLETVYTPGSLTAVGETDSGGHRFTVKASIRSDGAQSGGGSLRVSCATFCEVYISIKTGGIPELPGELDYETLRSRHISDFTSLTGRSDLSLSDEYGAESALPTNERLAILRETGVPDPGLAELYWRFGKYLLISSSRPGSLPANLQGVWCGVMKAPWNSDYHTNINLQMNYWHAEAVNISECTAPLFDYMNDYLLESGRHTAAVNYGCRGTVLHHLSDIYGFTAPADGLWGLWPLGGAWLCFHMWEHYLYTLDLDYLRDTAYRYISESARFFLDYMFERDGVLLSGPSTSPENRYLCGGERVSLCLSPTMDVEVIGGLLRFYVETERLLHINDAQAEEAERAAAKLPPLRVGKHGQLMEWLEDYDEPEPGHRHVSHMFALYPDCAINRSTRELFEAAKKTLERRLAHGGGHTGWSRAWLTALYARLGDGEAAGDSLTKLFTKSTKDNLYDTHPPFQIDGNFGGCAAITEMLLQSQNGELRLLPALPAEYKTGSFTGFRARGGCTVDAAWENGKLTYLRVTASSDCRPTVVFGGETLKLSLSAGESFVFGEK